MQSLAVLAAFWIAVLRYRGAQPARFVLGLAAAGVLAHLGWGLLHWPALRAVPAAWLDPTVGYCVLFAPLGVVIFTAEAAAFRTLPLALAVARSGCLLANCCRGPHGEPTPWLEIALWLALHASLERAPRAWVSPIFCASFGGARLALAPWRAAPPLGEPWLDPRWVAALWVALGGLFAIRTVARGARDFVFVVRGCAVFGSRGDGRIQILRKSRALLPIRGSGGREGWRPG